MAEHYYKRLVTGYKARTLSSEELAVYHQLLAEGKLDRVLREEMERDWRGGQESPQGARSGIDLPASGSETGSRSSAPRLGRRLMAAAASILLLLAAGLWIWQPWTGSQPAAQIALLDAAASPILTLPDGRQIPLGSQEIIGLEELPFQGDEYMLDFWGRGEAAEAADRGHRIGTSGRGETAASAASSTAAASAYHTLSIPAGRQYRLHLPDGSMVWLNASSSIRFPDAFGPNQRQVEIIGEAYFEVQHDPDRPFLVRAGGQQVTVLGTKFNISHYPGEEAIVTTLMEGSIRLHAGQAERLLQPNQQATLQGADQYHIEPVDAQTYMAWTNGFLHFRDEALGDILKAVARWYQVELTLAPALENEHYTLRFNQRSSLQELVDVLNAVGLRAELDGNLLRVQ